MNKATKAFITIKVLEVFGAGWFFSTYVLFLLGHNLSLEQVTQINICYMVVNFLFDPLTGSLADKIGQKKVFIIGQILWSIGVFVYGFGNLFWQFAMAEAISSVGSAMTSEALESWLRNVTSKEVSHKTMSKASSYAAIASIPPAILGSIVGNYFGMQYPWFLAGGFSLLVAVVAFVMLKELPDSKGEKDANGNSGSLKEAFGLLLKTKQLRFLVTITMATAFCFQAFNMFWTPMLKDLSGQAWWLGFMWMGIAGFSALGAHFVKEVKDANKKHIAIAIALTGIPMLLACVYPMLIPVVLGFLLHESGRGALGLLIRTYSNDYIENHVRSTTNSTVSALRTLGSAIGLLIVGKLSSIFPIITIWLIVAVLLVILALYVILYNEKD